MTFRTHLVILGGVCPSGFLPKPFVHVFLLHATCSTNFVIHVVTIMTFGEGCNVWCFSLCGLLWPSVNFFPIRAKHSPHSILVCCHSSCLPYSLMSLLIVLPVKLVSLKLRTPFL